MISKQKINKKYRKLILKTQNKKLLKEKNHCIPLLILAQRMHVWTYGIF